MRLIVRRDTFGQSIFGVQHRVRVIRFDMFVVQKQPLRDEAMLEDSLDLNTQFKRLDDR